MQQHSPSLIGQVILLIFKSQVHTESAIGVLIYSRPLLDTLRIKLGTVRVTACATKITLCEIDYCFEITPQALLSE